VHLSKSTGTSQTEAIFGLAIEAFLDKLRLQFEPIRYFGFGHPAPGSWKEGPNLRWTNAYGQQVSYDTTKPRPEAEADLRALIRRVATLRQRREHEIIKTLLSLFKEVQGQAQYISHLLGRIPHGNSTLSEPWQRAQESLLQLWEEKSKELACFRPDELDRLREFLEGHPAYQQVYAEEKTNIESFLHTGALRTDELIEMTGSRLTRSMKELLVEK
jgi:hypothetical protein